MHPNTFLIGHISKHIHPLNVHTNTKLICACTSELTPAQTCWYTHVDLPMSSEIFTHIYKDIGTQGHRN